MVGTPYYIAPEVLRAQDYTEACDLWSMGVIAYMLLSGTPPFAGADDTMILAKVKKGKFDLAGRRWTHISDDAKDFIRRLLEPKISKRLTAFQAASHPWLASAQAKEEERPLDPEVVACLKEFHSYSALKRAALEAIAFSMSGKMLRKMRHAFQAIDRDRTGYLHRDEFGAVLRKAGVGAAEIDKLFTDLDQDHTNQISYTEFLAATLSKKSV
jgi:calcium-dependent protein kinase